MVNNVEVLDPFADVAAARTVQEARRRRRLTALDEGSAFRGDEGRLLVLRAEMFADADEDAHRAAWQAEGSAALTELYQARWSERGVRPNWIETTVRGPADLAVKVDPRADWLRVEDHTDPRRQGVVSVYEHVTLWAGRAHAVVTVRHLVDQDLDVVVASVAAVLLARLTETGNRA